MGVLAIRVPNGAFYSAVRRRLDGIAGPVARALLAHNNLLGFPYRHGFTVQSIALLLEDTGFDIVRTHGDALVPIADEWTRGWAAAEERMIKTAMKIDLGVVLREVEEFDQVAVFEDGCGGGMQFCQRC